LRFFGSLTPSAWRTGVARGCKGGEIVAERLGSC